MSKRLNRSIRAAFVRAVLNDVPQIDYDEQITKLVQKQALEDATPAFREAYSHNEVREVLQAAYTPINDVDTGNQNGYVYIYRMANWTLKGDALKQAIEMHKAALEQFRAIGALNNKLNSVIRSVTTVKQATKLLPEFAKYLPEDTEETKETKDLPTVTNLVADLVSAGWPKNQTQGVQHGS